MQRRLKSLPGVLSVGSDVESGGGEEVRLTVDRAAATRAGLSANDIGRTVAFALRGQPYRPLRFVQPGPYKLIRHPLYFGWFCAFWGTPTMTGVAIAGQSLLPSGLKLPQDHVTSPVAAS